MDELPVNNIPRESAEIVNLTPHDIHMISHQSFIYRNMEPEVILTIPPSGKIARCEQDTKLSRQLVFQGHVLDVTEVYPKRVIDLPPPKAGTYYAVSKMVAEQLKGRGDLLVMHGLYKRKGQTAGCRSFTIW